MGKKFRVFLSSSFQDMHAERDYLRYHAFAALQAELLQKGHELQVMDLRGTTTQPELAEEEAVLRICLDGVEECIPRMVVLLGDRYGWIPYGEGALYVDENARYRAELSVRNISEAPKIDITHEEISGRSVTHLEIYYGFKRMPRENILFYERQGLPYEVMEPATREMFCAGKSAQDAMKTEIREKMNGYQHNIKQYKARWDANQCAVYDLDELNAMVYADLKASFEDELKEAEEERDSLEASDELIKNRARSSLLRANGQGLYIRPEIRQFVVTILEKQGYYWLSGDSGSGITTYTAQICYILEKTLENMVEKEERDSFVLVKFTPESVSHPPKAVRMLLDLAQQLLTATFAYIRPEEEKTLDLLFDTMILTTNAYFELEYLQDTAKRDEASAAMQELIGFCLKVLEEKADIYLVISDIDELLEEEESYKTLYWFANMPKNVTVLFSAHKDLLAPCFPYTALEIPLITELEPIKEILCQTAAESGKRFSDDIIDHASARLLEAGYNSPLEVRTFADSLVNMTGKDYMTFSGPDAHLQFMRSQIEKIDSVDIYSLLLNRLYEVHGDMATGALILMWVCIEPIPEQFFREALSRMLEREVSDLELFSLRGSLVGLLHVNRNNTEWKINHRSTLHYILWKYSILNEKTIRAAKRVMLQTLRQYMYPHPFVLETLLKFGVSEGEPEVLVAYAKCFSDSSAARGCLSRSFCETLNFGYFARSAELLRDDPNAFLFLSLAYFFDSPGEAVIMDDLLDEDADEIQRRYGNMNYEDCLAHVIGIAGEIFDAESFAFVYQRYCKALRSSYVYAEGSSEKKRQILQSMVRASMNEADRDEAEGKGLSAYGYFMLAEAANAQLLLCLEAKAADEQAKDFSRARAILTRIGGAGARLLLEEAQGNFLSSLHYYYFLLMRSGEASMAEQQLLEGYISMLKAIENPDKEVTGTLFSLYNTLLLLKNDTDVPDGGYNNRNEDILALLEEMLVLGRLLFPHKMLETGFISQYTNALYSLGYWLYIANRLDEAEKAMRNYFDTMVDLINNGQLSEEAIAGSELFSAAYTFTEIHLQNNPGDWPEETTFLERVASWMPHAESNKLREANMAARVAYLRVEYAFKTSEATDGSLENILAEAAAGLKALSKAAAEKAPNEKEAHDTLRREAFIEAITLSGLLFIKYISIDRVLDAGALLQPLAQILGIYVSADAEADTNDFDPYYRHHANANVRERYDFALSTLDLMMEPLMPEHASLKSALSDIIKAVKRSGPDAPSKLF